MSASQGRNDRGGRVDQRRSRSGDSRNSNPSDHSIHSDRDDRDRRRMDDRNGNRRRDDDRDRNSRNGDRRPNDNWDRGRDDRRRDDDDRQGSGRNGRGGGPREQDGREPDVIFIVSGPLLGHGYGGHVHGSGCYHGGNHYHGGGWAHAGHCGRYGGHSHGGYYGGYGRYGYGGGGYWPVYTPPPEDKFKMIVEDTGFDDLSKKECGTSLGNNFDNRLARALSSRAVVHSDAQLICSSVLNQLLMSLPIKESTVNDEVVKVGEANELLRNSEDSPVTLAHPDKDGICVIFPKGNSPPSPEPAESTFIFEQLTGSNSVYGKSVITSSIVENPSGFTLDTNHPAGEGTIGGEKQPDLFIKAKKGELSSAITMVLAKKSQTQITGSTEEYNQECFSKLKSPSSLDSGSIVEEKQGYITITKSIHNEISNSISHLKTPNLSTDTEASHSKKDQAESSLVCKLIFRHLLGSLPLFGRLTGRKNGNNREDNSREIPSNDRQSPLSKEHDSSSTVRKENIRTSPLGESIIAPNGTSKFRANNTVERLKPSTKNVKYTRFTGDDADPVDSKNQEVLSHTDDSGTESYPNRSYEQSSTYCSQSYSSSPTSCPFRDSSITENIGGIQEFGTTIRIENSLCPSSDMKTLDQTCSKSNGGASSDIPNVKRDVYFSNQQHTKDLKYFNIQNGMQNESTVSRGIEDAQQNEISSRNFNSSSNPSSTDSTSVQDFLSIQQYPSNLYSFLEEWNNNNNNNQYIDNSLGSNNVATKVDEIMNPIVDGNEVQYNSSEVFAPSLNDSICQGITQSLIETLPLSEVTRNTLFFREDGGIMSGITRTIEKISEEASLEDESEKPIPIPGPVYGALLESVADSCFTHNTETTNTVNQEPIISNAPVIKENNPENHNLRSLNFEKSNNNNVCIESEVWSETIEHNVIYTDKSYNERENEMNFKTFVENPTDANMILNNDKPPNEQRNPIKHKSCAMIKKQYLRKKRKRTSSASYSENSEASSSACEDGNENTFYDQSNRRGINEPQSTQIKVTTQRNIQNEEFLPDIHLGQRSATVPLTRTQIFESVPYGPNVTVSVNVSVPSPRYGRPLPVYSINECLTGTGSPQEDRTSGSEPQSRLTSANIRSAGRRK